jgi:hypothetical protein
VINDENTCLLHVGGGRYLGFRVDRVLGFKHSNNVKQNYTINQSINVVGR